MIAEVEKKEKPALDRAYYGYIHEASLVEMVFVVENMSAIDWDEISNTTFQKTKKEFVHKMLNPGNVVYCRDNGKNPVVLGGMWSDNPGVAVIWSCSTDEAKIRDWIFVSRWLKMMFNTAFKGGFHRIQAYSVPYRGKSHSYMANKRLGMEYEATLENFCENGHDVLIYKILRS